MLFLMPNWDHYLSIYVHFNGHLQMDMLAGFYLGFFLHPFLSETFLEIVAQVLTGWMSFLLMQPTVSVLMHK